MKEENIGYKAMDQNMTCNVTLISHNQKLSEDFIREFKDKIN